MHWWPACKVCESAGCVLLFEQAAICRSGTGAAPPKDAADFAQLCHYAEGTYVAPDGSMFPASYLVQRMAAEQMMWCYGVPHMHMVDGASTLAGSTGQQPAASCMPQMQPDINMIGMASNMAAAFLQQHGMMTSCYGPPHPSATHPAYAHVQSHAASRAASIQNSQASSPQPSPSPACNQQVCYQSSMLGLHHEPSAYWLAGTTL